MIQVQTITISLRNEITVTATTKFRVGVNTVADDLMIGPLDRNDPVVIARDAFIAAVNDRVKDLIGHAGE